MPSLLGSISSEARPGSRWVTRCAQCDLSHATGRPHAKNRRAKRVLSDVHRLHHGMPARRTEKCAENGARHAWFASRYETDNPDKLPHPTER
eukprot:365493-Chlamydomonas_euryale.AAC.4